VKPILKWAGGKRWLIPMISKMFEHFRDFRLVEPFAGGIAIALGLLPKKVLLNDANCHLINFYKWVKNGLDPTVIKMENNRETYYENRRKFNLLITKGKWSSPEAAALFYYLNRTGYNGLCRFNKKGSFNVPFGKYKHINYVLSFEEYETVFKNWDFSCGDFENIDIMPNDFIYADPPYDVEFTQYSKNGFTWSDQIRLVKWLDKFQNPIVLSNQATKRIVDLYLSYGYSLKYVNIQRAISCKARNRTREVIAVRNTTIEEHLIEKLL